MLRLVSVVVSVLAALSVIQLAVAQPSSAGKYVDIDGAGSTWVFPAMNTWRRDVQASITVNYNPSGSTAGRTAFKAGLADFGASEIPYNVQDGNYNDPAPKRGYAYIPDVAGGTTFMYNLNINGRRVTNLRLSGADIAGIFTNKITMWNDPRIKADNPQLALPATPITPVVRSDGSGATAQFTQWMLKTQGSYWRAYCAVVGRNPCTQTSAYPVQGGTAMHGVPGDAQVAGYVSQAGANGAIGYVEYAYAKQAGFPVAKLLNQAGYYTEPTPGHIAVSLLAAKINYDQSSDAYLTQDLSNVYTNPDPRTYELSGYSYMIIPTDLSDTTQCGGHPCNFTTDKGYTLGQFGSFMLCIGQSQVDVLGYSALPINLVQAGFKQLRKIPGNAVPVTDLTAISKCFNPTFSTNGTNTLAVNDPKPPPCDHQGPTQCSTPTGGAGGGGGGNGGGGGSGGNGGGVTGGTGGGGTGGSGGGGSGGSGGNSGSGGTTGNTPGSTAGTTPGSTAGAAGTSGTSGQSCDPNTGICGGSTGTNGSTGNSLAGSGQPVGDTPITLASNNGDSVQVMLMALAAGILLVLVAAPPLISQATKRSRQRRGIDDFYDDAGPGAGG